MTTSAGKVTLKIDVDNTDALRKIRQVRREARRARRLVSGSAWDRALSVALSGFGLAYGLVGMFRHSTFDVALACLFTIAAERSA